MKPKELGKLGREVTITAEFSSRQLEVEASTYDKISHVCSKFLHKNKYTCCLLVDGKILNPKKRVSQYMKVIGREGAKVTLEHFGE